MKLFYLLNSEYFVSLGGEGQIPNIHWNNERKCRKFTRLLCYFVVGNQGLLITSLSYSIVCICLGSYDTTNWLLQFSPFTPFNKGTLIGWYSEWFIQFSVGASYSMSMVIITSYFVCCCFYINTFCDHFDELCRLTKNDVEQMHHVNDVQKYRQLYHQINDRLCQAIEIHVTVFE